MFRIEQSGRSSLRRPKLPTKGSSASKEEEGVLGTYREEVMWATARVWRSDDATLCRGGGGRSSRRLGRAWSFHLKGSGGPIMRNGIR